LLISLVNKNIQLLNYIIILDSSPNAFHPAFVNSPLAAAAAFLPLLFLHPFSPLFLSLLYPLSKRLDTERGKHIERKGRREEEHQPSRTWFLRTPWAVELFPGIPSGFDEIHTEK